MNARPANRKDFLRYIILSLTSAFFSCIFSDYNDYMDDAILDCKDNVIADCRNNIISGYRDSMILDNFKTDAMTDHGEGNIKLSTRTMGIRIYNEKGKYDCEVCGKHYRTQASLNYHRCVECEKEPKFSCSSCAYKSKRKSNLRRHLQLHYKINYRPRSKRTI